MQRSGFTVPVTVPVTVAFVLAVLVGWFPGTVRPASAGKFNRVLDVGDAAPVWKNLAGIDDKPHSLADYKQSPIVVLVFTCNRCPVASVYEERFKRFVADYGPKGIAFVAISVSTMPQDSLEKMKQRAEGSEFNFPYLHDPTQQVGKEYGATATPQLFVLDAKRRIAYMGAFDDDLNPEKVRRHYLIDAVDALLAGKNPEVGETRPAGCPIEYE